MHVILHQLLARRLKTPHLTPNLKHTSKLNPAFSLEPEPNTNTNTHTVRVVALTLTLTLTLKLAFNDVFVIGCRTLRENADAYRCQDRSNEGYASNVRVTVKNSKLGTL